MYGECQVLSSVGPNAAGEHLFSKPTAMFGTPNLNFLTNTPFQSPALFSALVPREEISGLQKCKEEETESGSSGSGNYMDGGYGEDQEGYQPKKKRYRRHTARQIQEMESLFKECPHPDEKQRLKLSQELGLKPRQVKFWFQNRRTQLKAQQDRSSNVVLRAENESLKSENFRLQTAMRSITCANCGSPAIIGDVSYDEQHLRFENLRLREELDRLCGMASRFSSGTLQELLGSMQSAQSMHSSLNLDMGVYSRHLHEPMETSLPIDQIIPAVAMPESPTIGLLESEKLMHSSLNLDMGVYSRHLHEPMEISLPTDQIIPAVAMPGSPTIGLLESEKPLALELAAVAMEQLSRMSQDGEPLWMRSREGGREVLNLEEYSKAFSWPVSVKDHGAGDLRTEASRDSALVIMNAASLVGFFLDANKWVEMFPSIVARARTIQVITNGLGNTASGSLQLMHAELQFLSPLVASREFYFLRFCLQQPSPAEGVWAIVDFPVDGFNEGVQLHNMISSPNTSCWYRRLPSGLLIQDMPNGYSKLTWVEHGEVDDGVVHQSFRERVLTGSAFGAERWLANLQRQCERLASLMSSNTMERDLGVANSVEARRSIMHLAGRMVRMFSISITSAQGQPWTALGSSADDNVLITTRKCTGPGKPHGVILCGVSSTWLPFSHIQVFDQLRNGKTRAQLDMFSGGNSFEEVVHIANGSHPGNCVSLLRMNATNNSAGPGAELMVQESFTDASGSMVVYAPIDVTAVNVAMSGGDTSSVSLLPSGFSIAPWNDDNSGSCTTATDAGSGCILTLAFQVLASAVATSKTSMSTVTTLTSHICNAVRQIHTALGASRVVPNPGFDGSSNSEKK